jgi:hypothetical protein
MTLARATLITGLVALSPTAYSSSLSVLYRFQGRSDGASPYAGLAVGKDGTLYGTVMNAAGSTNHGTVLQPKSSAHPISTRRGLAIRSPQC